MEDSALTQLKSIYIEANVTNNTNVIIIKKIELLIYC